jgi:N-acyl-D-amino-acid deacylase
VTGKNAPSFAIFDRGMIALLKQTEVPGGALAVAKNGRIVYNRGFGYADRDKKEPVLPSSLFRIASISKPLTAVAVLQLVEKNKLKLDDKVFDILKLEEPKGVTFDARWKTVTILELLQHTGGWDSDASFDPMFRSPSIVDELKIKAPADQRAIIRYMLRKPLQFDPGTQHHYSNFGYCLLGRVIEKVSDRSYKDYVQENVLAPLGIDKMRLGKTLLNDRAENEVRYYTANDNKQTAILGPDLGKPVLAPYGGWNLEAMDAHGGWLATAEDLVRFSSAFDNPKKCKILSEKSIAIMYARPEGAPGMDKDGKPSASYYGCGWYVRVVQPGKVTLWHSGSTEGTSTELVRRQEGLTWVTWAVLFNSRDTPTKKQPIELIGKLLHEAADSVKQWPR